jgi:ABC-type lipoprotein release transport system permease subunit
VAAVRLAWRDLASFRWQAAAIGTVLAVSVLAFVALGSYRQALEQDYAVPTESFLVVQQDQSFAEFYGSRIPADIADLLAARGSANPVPEIHAVVGTSLQDAVLLRGIDLGGYTRLDRVDVRAGRGLAVGDGPRTAMIGVRLAERLGLSPGEDIRLRGRVFKVVGIFETGTYTENEAWVPLAGAQQLLGWGQEVSLFVVPADGPLVAGQQLAPGLSVARRGELWSTFPAQWHGLLTLIQAVAQAIGLAAALSLSAVLWRLAWRRRWHLAVLRTIGFNRWLAVGYLGAQGSVIALGGSSLGIIGAEVLLRAVRLNLAGVSLRPQLSPSILVSSGLWVGVLTLISISFPAWMLGRRSVIELMSGS